ncbi:hypothetical protein [Nocardioides sp. AX2bis]|uniref:hypothetical protein n=1 Tax=Nocardioides sp. AX2bis TaxID=2653157 RepID=UPI0012F0802F|nr:hypothetical protein [Nocardioides sp. AX2bis]VXC55085.1 conserved hypothetical protein [Nocardioides sp. AX2bis]
MTHEHPGDHLADRLDLLGLTGALAAAGLPTAERGADGHAVWTDPLTGRALSDTEIEQLDLLLRQEGSDPRHAVPVGLVQVARQARLRDELLASRWHDYASLAGVRGATVEATRFSVHKAAATHRLLLVTAGEQVLVPAFQLGTGGEVRADLVPVLEPLLTSAMDPWRVWAWLTHPAALLGGAVPEQVAADPEEADLVLHAAVRLAERSRHTT